MCVCTFANPHATRLIVLAVHIIDVRSRPIYVPKQSRILLLHLSGFFYLRCQPVDVYLLFHGLHCVERRASQGDDGHALVVERLPVRVWLVAVGQEGEVLWRQKRPCLQIAGDAGVFLVCVGTGRLDSLLLCAWER